MLKELIQISNSTKEQLPSGTIVKRPAKISPTAPFTDYDSQYMILKVNL